MNYNLQRKSQLDARELMLLESEVKTYGKNMVVAYVLWYFLGIFGAHRFYMGKIGTAVTQLILSLTFFGMAVTMVWWIVDAFLVHTWVKERNAYVESNIIDQILVQKPISSDYHY
ncbi:TM2 domain-containing protein [Paenibacillus wenxiniae]|uniref:TM2 domain-containing protein n=1 Tax=Paenibacillus wenxiniae TaxID=1636843 RepID=A0ABW4RLE2_9BACL